MIRRLYEMVTGNPWTTTTSATEQFGPPPGAVYAAELSRYTDAELIAADRDELLASFRRRDAAIARALLANKDQEVTR
jgi:hypothetical protein